MKKIQLELEKMRAESRPREIEYIVKFCKEHNISFKEIDSIRNSIIIQHISRHDLEIEFAKNET